MFGYREDNKEYWGHFHIKIMIWVASILMIFTQLYITIWFLTFHDWWWFFSLGFALPANIALPYSVITRKPPILKFILVYQLLYTCLFLSSVIDLIIRLAHPHHGYFYTNCHLGIDKCAHRVRVLTGVYMCVYLLFAFLNFFCLTVIWNYYKYITGESPISFNRSSSRPSQPSGQRNPPTPVFPRDDPAPVADPKPSTPSGGATLSSPAGGNSDGTSPGFFSTTSSAVHTPYQAYNPPPPAGTTSFNSSSSYSTYNTQSATGAENPSNYNNSGQAGYTSQEVSAPSGPPLGLNPDWGAAPSYQPPAFQPQSTTTIHTPGPPPPPRPNLGTLYDETPGEY